MKSIRNKAIAFMLGIWLLSCQSSGVSNQTVEKAFKTHFGRVDSVRWTHNVDYSYAHFKQNGRMVIAVFGNDGQFIETEAAKPGV